MIVDALLSIVGAVLTPVIETAGTVVRGLLGFLPTPAPFVTAYSTLNVGLPLDSVLLIIATYVGIKGAAVLWHTIKEVVKWIPLANSGGE
jgi:hypothetical protein